MNEKMLPLFYYFIEFSHFITISVILQIYFFNSFFSCLSKNSLFLSFVNHYLSDYEENLYLGYHFDVNIFFCQVICSRKISTSG